MIHTRFILIETSHAGNVGAVARAIKVMGFHDLVLVRPRWANVLRREETIQRASGALDVLKNAQIVDTLDQALLGMTHLCATAMTARDFGPPTRSPRVHLGAFVKEVSDRIETTGATQNGIAFLFGSERFGMTNEDVYRCNVALQIPSNPDFGSLNIAAAVQLIAYEWRLCLGGFEGTRSEIDRLNSHTSQAGQLSQNPSAYSQASSQTDAALDCGWDTSGDKLADAQQIGGLLSHWQAALEATGFLDPLAPKKLMPRLNQLFNRARMTVEEVHIFRGVAKAMIRVSELAGKTAPTAQKTVVHTPELKKDRL